MNTKIYVLFDPFDKTPKYIGKSDDPNKRLVKHINSSLNKKGRLTKKEAWIRSLLNKGIEPDLFILDEVPIDEWDFWEIHYISLYKTWGFDLKNGTPGGDTGPSMLGKKHTQETIDKIQNSRNKVKDLISKNISIAKKGIPQTKEHIESLSKVRKGKIPWNKNKSGYSSKKKGFVMNEEQKEKISISMSDRLKKDYKSGKRKSNKGLKYGEQLKISCPYCDKRGGASAMKQWHFDKCKNKLL
jgi:hypothetical protein